MKTFLSILTVVGILLASVVSAASMINIDLGAGTNVGTGTAGVVASDGWQVKSAYPDFSDLSLKFEDGSNAATTVSGDGSGNVSSIGATTTDGDYSMFNRGLGIEGSASFSTLTLNNLTSDFSSGYDIYVYFASATNTSIDVVNTHSIGDGTTTYYLEADETQASYQGSYIQATATSAGASVLANYVKFSNLSADTVTISAQNFDNITASAGLLTGMQIVAIPEPSSIVLSLLGFSLIGGILRRRTRR